MSHRTLFAAALLAGSVIFPAGAAELGGKSLLSQDFEARNVVQIEVGDFHFTPGQLAPLHTHVAPVFGYVAKGTIFYQVEGQQPQILKTGDAFYEPVGRNILHFDNASKTEEAIFVDYNFERSGEPFIVFPKPLTEKIDRRAFPSESLDGGKVSHMEVREEYLAPAAKLAGAAPGEKVAAYVADGQVSVKIGNEAPILYLPGQSFYVAEAGQAMVNPSTEKPAKLILFHLSKGN